MKIAPEKIRYYNCFIFKNKFGRIQMNNYEKLGGI